jgi:5-methylcytosine-specific restriction endonuclease McrA
MIPAGWRFAPSAHRALQEQRGESLARLSLYKLARFLKAPAPRMASPSATRLVAIDSAGGAAKAHYQSAEHKAWRATVLARDRFTCQNCGAHGPAVRLVADHVREIADKGAPLDVANGRTLCLPCHNAKTAKARAARMQR